jgi:hypothetical protein
MDDDLGAKELAAVSLLKRAVELDVRKRKTEALGSILRNSLFRPKRQIFILKFWGKKSTPKNNRSQILSVFNGQ